MEEHNYLKLMEFDHRVVKESNINPQQVIYSYNIDGHENIVIIYEGGTYSLRFSIVNGIWFEKLLQYLYNINFKKVYTKEGAFKLWKRNRTIKKILKEPLK